MPEPVTQPGQLKPGDLFEDCRYHPCLCTEANTTDDTDGVYGVSLVDGSPCGCSVRHCGLRKLTIEEVVRWKHHGPADVDLAAEDRWW